MVRNMHAGHVRVRIRPRRWKITFTTPTTCATSRDATTSPNATTSTVSWRSTPVSGTSNSRRERVRGVHAARTRMAPGPRRAHLGAVRRTAGHAAGFRTFRRTGNDRRLYLRQATNSIAFTYGSAVNDHTFDTHVEKADTDYDGAFTIINKLFAQHLPARFTMINREEDLGIDGLRQSKLSYHPAVIQHKYAAIHLHPDEIACKELWTAAFGDDEQFVDSFLMRYYSRRRMLTAECEGRTAAMLHMLPFESGAGTVDLHLRRSDSARIPPQGTGRQADTRSDAAHRRAGRRGGLPRSRARSGCTGSMQNTASKAPSR